MFLSVFDGTKTKKEVANFKISVFDICQLKDFYSQLQNVQESAGVSNVFLVYLVGYNLQTKPCRPVDHGPVCSGPKGDILQTKYLADQTLCRLYSE